MSFLRSRLSERDIQQIFDREIAPRLMAGVGRPEQPWLLFVFGQPGSGKTTAQRQVLERIGPVGAVIADTDSLKSYHPGYADLLVKDDQTAALVVARASNAWTRMAIDLAERHRVHLIREGSYAPRNEATRFAAAGYTVEADVMAVPAAISRLSVLLRYQLMRDELGFGRLVRTGTHDRVFESLPRILADNDHRKFIPQVRLHRWGGETIYADRLDANGEWQDPTAARAVLETERNRELTAADATWFTEQFNALSRSLPPNLRAQLPQIAALARPLGIDLANTPTPDQRTRSTPHAVKHTKGSTPAAPKPASTARFISAGLAPAHLATTTPSPGTEQAGEKPLRSSPATIPTQTRTGATIDPPTR
ncbi:zeta toxin [Kribbella amoyensis]|uniref:UDP-N-acetylglucosamine kinase n=1 Tax=Kribbella amoyensis TaxID=996641 RepID=A0A561BMG0_9ACTN|nr:zeta toxin family protein [Kribbella amoyensis]TWD80028.1 zeta toxin [Kribbella amoyensis]